MENNIYDNNELEKTQAAEEETKTENKTENTKINNENTSSENKPFDYRYGYPDMINPQGYYNAQPQQNPQGYYNAQPQQNPQGYYNAQPQQNPQGYYSAQPQQNPQGYYNAQPQHAPNYNQNYGYYPQNLGYQQKNRIIAGLFGVLMGGIGLHNFYLGYTGRAIAQLLVTVFTCGLGSIWGFIEGILIIAGSYKGNVDANGIYTKEI